MTLGEISEEPAAAVLPVLEFAFGEVALRQVPVSASKDLTGWAERHPGVRIQRSEEHAGAALMVVARKRAAWFGAAPSLLQHAPCPVAVVPEA